MTCAHRARVSVCAVLPRCCFCLGPCGGRELGVGQDDCGCGTSGSTSSLVPCSLLLLAVFDDALFVGVFDNLWRFRCFGGCLVGVGCEADDDDVGGVFFVCIWQEDDDMLVPPQDFNDGIEPMEGVSEFGSVLACNHHEFRLDLAVGRHFGGLFLVVQFRDPSQLVIRVGILSEDVDEIFFFLSWLKGFYAIGIVRACVAAMRSRIQPRLGRWF